MIRRVVIAYSCRGHAVDGIRDHSERIVEQLRSGPYGVEVDYVDFRGLSARLPTRILAVAKRLRTLDAESALVLQYNPFAFGRWGFAPWLPLVLASSRLRRSRPAVAVMVHEPYVPMSSIRWALLGVWQRLQLAAIRACADITFASIDAWEATLRASLPRGRVRHLPVGSNFPDCRERRESVRRELGVGDGAVVVSALGRDHPSWLSGHAVAAANAVAAAGGEVVLVVLGATAPNLEGLDPAVRLERPGLLSPEDLAGRLAASDLFLAPLIDGVSTRRGSVMAGLQHGLAVVGTEGPLTDPVLAGAAAAIRLVPVGSPAKFAAAAAELARAREEREAMGRTARQLYEKRFDWPVVAGSLLDSLAAA